MNKFGYLREEEGVLFGRAGFMEPEWASGVGVRISNTAGADRFIITRRSAAERSELPVCPTPQTGSPRASHS